MRGLSLAETLVAGVLTALVMAAVLGMISNWSILARSTMGLGGRGAGDAQTQLMMAEIRSAYQLISLYNYDANGNPVSRSTPCLTCSESQVVLAISSGANYSPAPVINGVVTGRYWVTFDSTYLILRFDGSSGMEQIGGSGIARFTAYDASGNAYTWVDRSSSLATTITALGVTITNISGQPTEQELIVFSPSPTYTLIYP